MSPRTLLITGARGTLSQAFKRICEQRGLACRVVARDEFDIADEGSVTRGLKRYKPWAVINAAGYVQVDRAEEEPERCFRENTLGPTVLAQECQSRKTAFMTFSTDLVFEGDKASPYEENDPTAPLNVYGRSKVVAEHQVMEVMPSALIIRTSAFFGPWDQYNFLAVALKALAEGQLFRAAQDAVVSPTYVPDLVHACLDLLVDGSAGIWHLSNWGAVTWSAFARQAASLAGVQAQSLEECPLTALQLRARRPQYSALGSERALLLPPLEDAMQRYVATLK